MHPELDPPGLVRCAICLFTKAALAGAMGGSSKLLSSSRLCVPVGRNGWRLRTPMSAFRLVAYGRKRRRAQWCLLGPHGTPSQPQWKPGIHPCSAPPPTKYPILFLCLLHLFRPTLHPARPQLSCTACLGSFHFSFHFIFPFLTSFFPQTCKWTA